MADGVGYTPGIGITVATDDVGGFQYQRIKPVWGGDGIVHDTSPTNPLPVGLGDNARYFANAYEVVPASSTARVLGPGSGAFADYIAGVLVVPETLTPGAVTLLDGGTGNGDLRWRGGKRVQPGAVLRSDRHGEPDRRMGDHDGRGRALLRHGSV